MDNSNYRSQSFAVIDVMCIEHDNCSVEEHTRQQLLDDGPFFTLQDDTLQQAMENVLMSYPIVKDQGMHHSQVAVSSFNGEWNSDSGSCAGDYSNGTEMVAKLPHTFMHDDLFLSAETISGNGDPNINTLDYYYNLPLEIIPLDTMLTPLTVEYDSDETISVNTIMDESHLHAPIEAGRTSNHPDFTSAETFFDDSHEIKPLSTDETAVLSNRVRYRSDDGNGGTHRSVKGVRSLSGSTPVFTLEPGQYGQEHRFKYLC